MLVHHIHSDITGFAIAELENIRDGLSSENFNNVSADSLSDLRINGTTTANLNLHENGHNSNGNGQEDFAMNDSLYTGGSIEEF